MEDIIIFGAGGLGREAAFLIDRINQNSSTWNLLGFVDDTPALQGKVLNGVAVLGTSDYFEKYESKVHLVCALGDPKSKKMIVDRLSKYPFIKFASLIDPQAVVSSSAEIGCGTMVFANTIISVNVVIRDHVLIYYNNSIAHDVTIDDYSSINHGVNISGNVNVGKCSRFGVGSKTIEKINIGEEVLVGAGAIVINDIDDHSIVAGVPAKPLK